MRIWLIVFMLFFSSLSYAEDIASLRKSLQLGNTQFDTACRTAEANEHFQLGAAFLHAFMYDLALAQFQQAEKLDPGCPMAYWGEAMTHKYQIWSTESLAAAEDALNRYKKNQDKRVLTEKEKYYLGAAERLFNHKTLLERDKAYAAYMANFYKKFPEDPNVASFYALSLMELPSDFPKDPSDAKLMSEGRQLIDALYQQFPSHPGVVHYFMHYHDTADRASAEKALPAAKTALIMMSSSSHVAHMAAHIYRRLALWEDFVHANEVSIEASDVLCEKLNNRPIYACDADNKYHSMEWLHDGYLKTGKINDAQKLVDKVAAISAHDPALMYRQWYYRMWSRQLFATRDWAAKPITISPIAVPGDALYWSAYSECAGLLANGYLAVHQKQPIDEILNRLEVIIVDTNKLSDPYIQQSCTLANLYLKAEDARVKGENHLASIEQQIDAAKKQRISTELTPSLDILPSL